MKISQDKRAKRRQSRLRKAAPGRAISRMERGAVPSPSPLSRLLLPSSLASSSPIPRLLLLHSSLASFSSLPRSSPPFLAHFLLLPFSHASSLPCSPPLLTFLPRLLLLPSSLASFSSLPRSPPPSPFLASLSLFLPSSLASPSSSLFRSPPFPASPHDHLRNTASH